MMPLPAYESVTGEGVPPRTAKYEVAVLSRRFGTIRTF
jgi:hypothetical protein